MTKIILTSLIVLFGFTLSGILVLLDVNTITGIHFSIWFLIFSSIGFLYYRYKFKKLSAFRYTLIKNYVKFNLLFREFDKKIANLEDSSKSLMQEKAVKLWKLCLRDRTSNISCSISNHIRQIEKNNLLIILSPLNQIDYLMSIIDIDNGKNCIYEIRIGQKLAESVIYLFDQENEKRMKEGEDARRRSIYNDLDKLLSQQDISKK